MADNYLEKRYREVFGEGSRVDPETGYASSRPKSGITKRISELYSRKKSVTGKNNNEQI